MVADIERRFLSKFLDLSLFKMEQNGISEKLHKLLRDFLGNRKQRLGLDGQVFTWANVKAGVPKGSVFLIYINDLPKGLSSNAKLFPEDTSLFSIIHDSSTTRNELNGNWYIYEK